MLAKELGPLNVRVNSINRGMVETEGTARGRGDRERLPKAVRGVDAAGADCPASGNRADSGVSGLAGFGLVDRGDAARLGRVAVMA